MLSASKMREYSSPVRDTENSRGSRNIMASRTACNWAGTASGRTDAIRTAKGSTAHSSGGSSCRQCSVKASIPPQ